MSDQSRLTVRLKRCSRCRLVLGEDETIWVASSLKSEHETCPNCGGQSFWLINWNAEKSKYVTKVGGEPWIESPRPQRIKLTFEGKEQNEKYYGFGKTFLGAAISLLNNIKLAFNPAREYTDTIFIALSELAQGEDKATHFDFSTPEEAFELTIEGKE